MSKFALGQSVTRIEDAALVQGAGRYTDDFELAGAAHACILRSPHAHASITNIDTAADMSQVLIQQYLNQLRDLRKVSDQRIAW